MQPNKALRVRRLVRGDEQTAQALFTLMAQVFETEQQVLSQTSIQHLLAREDFWVLAAFLDVPQHSQQGTETVLAGGLTAYTLPLRAREHHQEVFLYDLAVQAEHQRKGVGRDLVKTLCTLASEQGISTMFVAADNEDVHAIDFYKALGGTDSPVTMFTFDTRH